jgi:putative phage-type endonuclease
MKEKVTIYNDIHQRSEEWYNIRLGRVGGSESSVLSVKGKSESGLGAAAFTLLYEKAYEIIQEEPVKENIVTFAMQRGMDLEPEAIHEYELSKMVKVDQVGYILNSDFKYAGYSPDGLVGEDGLIEVKCPGNSEFMRQIITNEIPKQYFCQMQWGMFISGRKWCDYVVYNPDYHKSPLYIDRVDRIEKTIETLKANYLAFESELDAILERI